MNVMGQLEFGLTYYEVAGQQFNHNITIVFNQKYQENNRSAYVKHHPLSTDLVPRDLLLIPDLRGNSIVRFDGVVDIRIDTKNDSKRKVSQSITKSKVSYIPSRMLSIES